MTKKNSLRIMRNRKTGVPFIMQSKQHDSWAFRAILQLQLQRSGKPINYPVNMGAVVYRERAAGDLLNYLAAVSDALEGAGIVEDDRLIVSLDGCRMEKDAKRPRVEVTITEVLK